MAAILFSGLHFFVKIGTPSLPPAQLNFVRGAVGVLLLLPFLRKEIPLLVTKKHLSLWARSLFGALATLALFHNIQLSGTSFAIAMANLASIFVVLFSVMFFRETLTLIEWIGVAVVLGASFALDSPFGVKIAPAAAIIGLIGACCGGIAMTSLKQAANQFSPLLIVWGFSLFSMITALMMPGGDWSWRIEECLFILIPTGLCGLLGQIFLTKSYERLPAIIATACSLSSIIWNLLIESIYFGMLPKSFSLLMYLLFLVGLLVLQTGRARKKESLSK